MPPKINYSAVAQQTKRILKAKNFRSYADDAIGKSIRYGDDVENPVPKLKPENCPRFRVPVYGDDEYDGYEFGCRIEVVNADAFETAIALAKDLTPNDPYVAVLNLANPSVAGGGWLTGATAQEEYLCYRSSLSETLDQEDYPISGPVGIYSPSVAIFRKSKEQKYIKYTNEEQVDYVAVLTAAATNKPKTCTKPKKENSYTPLGVYYADPEEPELLREKIRIILRMAAYHGHSRIVLGAIGCGVFNNPRERVAELFFHVFMEEEFTGGWFEHIVFAITERGTTDGWDPTRSFDIFWRKLNGVVV